jgi:hypothetical protein
LLSIPSIESVPSLPLDSRHFLPPKRFESSSRRRRRRRRRESEDKDESREGHLRSTVDSSLLAKCDC